MGMIIRDEVNYTHGGNANYKEVTQAEYDALSLAKKNNGTMYFITDAPDDTTIAPIIYSDEEREVGVWRDGKPLYQKSYYVASPTKNAETRITDNTIQTIDVCVSLYGTYKRTSSSNIMTYTLNGREGSYSDEDSFIRVDMPDSGNYGFTYYLQSVNSTITDLIFTIQYTKTTDTPGSGKWAPSGVPAVHYSTEEKVVGTWIDGSTIYEKTIQLPSRATWNWNSGYNMTSLMPTDVSQIIYAESINTQQYGSATVTVQNESNTWYGYAYANTLVNYVTIRYTKSS